MSSRNIFSPKKAGGFKQVPILETEQTVAAGPEFVPVSIVLDVCDEQELVGEIGLGVLSDMVLEHGLGIKECQALMARKEEIAQMLRDALSPIFVEMSDHLPSAEKQLIESLTETTIDVLVDCRPSEQLMREAVKSTAFKESFREQIRPVMRQYLEQP